MIPILGIPTYCRHDMLARLIRSIDFPVAKLVIVQNGPQLDTNPMRGNPHVREMVHIIHPNAGVAGAWNEIITLFPADYWMISNDDIEFQPDALRRMHEACMKVKDTQDDADTPLVWYGFGMSWFSVLARGIERIGTFDENFFPAYMEDIDWQRRMRILGVKERNVGTNLAIHGDAARPDDHSKGSRTANSSPELAAKIGRYHDGNRSYYSRKWGGGHGQEKFSTPFNDPNWPMWAWRFEPAQRARQQW